MVVVEWGCRCLWSQLVTWDNYSHCTSGRWWWWGWGSLFHGQSSWGSSSDPPLEYQQEWSPQRQGELWSSGKISIHVFSIILQNSACAKFSKFNSYISAEEGMSDLCTYHTLCCDHKWMQSGSSSWSEWSKQTCFIWLTKPIQTKISICFDPIDFLNLWVLQRIGCLAHAFLMCPIRSARATKGGEGVFNSVPSKYRMSHSRNIP